MIGRHSAYTISIHKTYTHATESHNATVSKLYHLWQTIEHSPQNQYYNQVLCTRFWA